VVAKFAAASLGRPALLRRLGLPEDIDNVVFALSASQALPSGESASQSLRRLFGVLWRRPVREIAPLQRQNLGAITAPPPS
jgi:branched-chain amino acid transport system permease protein